ncbi:PAAR domain-containing protein [Burkholderia sp. AU45388]|uniref:PAAR domain-containing protein n=1 Tax=Burkholderia sp. AU45388 TaxID=3059206 RepID=UPI00264B6265|nr:PAAR domain-containing protein [Burkholderia sp. AU45388]MDN7430769.1 PAAR domain-containing protein [Burkholderia sp. AU45388]
MVRQVIVVGDTLGPHGGTVTAGSNADVVNGKPIARKGDTVECKEHGSQTRGLAGIREKSATSRTKLLI